MHLSMVAPVPDAHLSFIEQVRGLLAGLLVLLEDDDLRVLAAELDDRADVGVQLLDRERDGVDLLHELRAERLAQRARARAGHEQADLLARDVSERLPDAHQELEHAVGLLRVVALVVVPEDLLALRIDDARLDGRRADVEPDHDLAAAHRDVLLAARLAQPVFVRSVQAKSSRVGGALGANADVSVIYKH